MLKIEVRLPTSRTAMQGKDVSWQKSLSTQEDVSQRLENPSSLRKKRAIVQVLGELFNAS